MRSTYSDFLKSLSKKAILIGVAFLLSSCSLHEKKETPKSYQVYSEVFYSTYSKVWRAAQMVLTDYQLSLNNMDTGRIETALIKEEKIWHPVHIKNLDNQGLQYTLNFKIIKGKNKKKEAVKVVIKKSLERRMDFFSDPKPLPTDGLEEEILLYRIRRQIVLDSVLETAGQKKGAPGP